MSESPLILIVEDYENKQYLARLVLERDGCRVDLAGTLVEALYRISIRPPDLILIDIRLGGEDRGSFTSRLKANPATATIPIVALTAPAMAGDRKELLAAGFEGYISKPIDTRTFTAQVRRHLPQQGSPKAA